jgi:hypothetical protein
MPEQQLSLEDIPKTFPNEEPLARTEHPETSHLAGEKLTNSGKRDSWKHRLLVWMIEHSINTPEAARTAHELARDSGLPHTSWHKRLPDLSRDGFVMKWKRKTCSVTGEDAWTWVVKPREDGKK